MNVVRYEGVVIDVPDWCKYVAANGSGIIHAFETRPSVCTTDLTTWSLVDIRHMYCGRMDRKDPSLIGPLCEVSDLRVRPDSLTWAIYVLGKFEYMAKATPEIGDLVKIGPPRSAYDNAMSTLRMLHNFVA